MKKKKTKKQLRHEANRTKYNDFQKEQADAFEKGKLIEGLGWLIFSSVLFSVFTIIMLGIREGFSSENTIVSGILGALIGVLIALEYDSSYFKYPNLLKICCSIAASLLIVFIFFEGSLENYTIGVLFALLIASFSNAILKISRYI